MKDVLDVPTINDFLTFGLVAPGRSFFKTSEADADGDLWAGTAGTRPIDKFDAAVEHLHAGLLASLEFIFKHRRPDSLAVSGGADSRLLLSLLSQYFLSELRRLRIYTRVHPNLTVDTDRDAYLAHKITAHLGLRCEVERPSFHARAYLYPYDKQQRLVLSGLWGGELLGGQIVTISSLNWENIVGHDEESPLRQLCLSKIKNEPEFLRYRVQRLSKLFWKSRLTALYESHLWLSPKEVLNWTVSPFLTPVFNDCLGQVDSELLEDYRLQRYYLIKYGGPLVEFDINNPQVQTAPLTAEVQRTVEPKSLPLDKEVSRSVLEAHQTALLEYVESQPQRRYFSFLKNHIHLIPS